MRATHRCTVVMHQRDGLRWLQQLATGNMTETGVTPQTDHGASCWEDEPLDTAGTNKLSIEGRPGAKG
ncbi:unnamed protein product [Boreogadus saida]